jgi:flavodoxin
MCTEIYSFSGTGNSLHVARELQKRLPDAALVPILNLEGQGSPRTSAETVGFVFPHYASSLPKVVRAFIEKLDLASATYLFAIATRGGTKTWAFVELDEILREKERWLDSHWAITMAGGNDALVKGYADQINEERIERLEAAMLSRLDSICRIVVDRESSSFCPKQSIQIKSKWYLRSYTEQNGRYHPPEIAANDIASQKVQAKEALR